MRAVLFLFFAILSFFVAGQSDDRVKLRDLQEAPGNDYIIVSLNDTAHWVLPASIMVNLYTSNGTIDAVRQVTLSDAAQLIIGDTSETVLFTMYPDEFNPQIGLSTTSDDNTETSMLFLQQSDAQIQSGNAGNYTVLMIDNDGHVTVTRTTGAASFAVNAGDPDATLDVGGGAMLLPDSVTYSAGLNRIVMIDSLTGRLHYINATDIETGGGTTYYQTLRDDGTPVTQRDAINFVATSTVATTLTDDAGNGETEVALSVPTGGITSTQILDGTITASDVAFLTLPSGTSNQTLRSNGSAWVANSVLTTDGVDDLNLTASVNGPVRYTLTNSNASSGARADILAVNNSGAIAGITMFGSTFASPRANNAYFFSTRDLVLSADANTSSGGGSFKITMRPGGVAGTEVLDARNSGVSIPTLRLVSSTSLVTSGGAVIGGLEDVSNDGRVVTYATGSTATRGLWSEQHSNNTAGAANGFRKSRGTAPGSPAAVTDGTAIGAFVFQGYSGTQYLSDNSLFGASVTGSVTTSSVPTSVWFISGSTANAYDPDLLIHSNGRVGVGAAFGSVISTITAPSARLHVVGEGATSATSPLLVENSSGTDILYADDSGQVAIGTNIPARKFHVAGEARITDLTTDTPTRIVGADADGDLNEIAVSSELLLSGGVLSVGTLSHAALSDLGSPEDDHDQYLNIFGRAGGQIVYGATGASENLDLNSTTNATKGNILLQDEGGNVIIGGAATASRLRMLEASGSGTNYTEFVTQAQAANITYTLPPDDGDSGEQLQTNGSGSLSWQPPGKAADVQEYPFPGTDTYIIPTGVRTVEIICIGAGGGGGSGRRGATTEANTGGGGGGGGAYTVATFAVSELASTTLDLTIGTGGTGGAARSTDNTSGADGGIGGDTYVECSGYTIILAEGGDFGRGGSTAEAAGGSANDVGDFFGYAGASSPTSGTPASTAGTFTKAAGGGGAGGSIATGGTPAVNGGACGKWNYATLSTIAGGTAPGGNGNDCPAVNTQHWIGGNGGSGGASSITGNAGTGGTGAQGGGGGGGGASLNATGNSGAGGTGGAGFIMIIAKY